MQVNIIFNDFEIQSKLARLQSLVEDMTPAYRAIGRLLYQTTKSSFRQSATPWGESWLPWKDKNKLDKRDANPKRRGRRLLVKSRFLYTNFSFKADKSGVIFGTNVKYAPVHQFGRRDGKMPARSFMPIKKDGSIPDEIKKQILDLINDYIIESLIE